MFRAEIEFRVGDREVSLERFATLFLKELLQSACASSAQNCWQAFLEVPFAPVIDGEWVTWKTVAYHR
jgi:hypothetical protein